MRKLIFSLLLSLFAAAAVAANKLDIHKPDLEKIKEETLDPQSKRHYQKLLKKFMSNDTIMNTEDFEYFYFGTLFQEDYDPYRAVYDQLALDSISPLYYKADHTRSELNRMENYARRALEDNPLDLAQLKNLVFVHEKKGKVNLAKIWKNKLNHLLLAIAQSGTGLDPDNAWVVVYPRHEFDFLNISGLVVEGSEFQEPYYEKFRVKAKSDKDPSEYYFNLQPVLEQYYLKHPTEM
ncbi:MAG: DUF4919 domain-containing protein [Lachnospiraceae bacterium]|nr:DUF4919 domain-containing protein [Lachnospiraceae bacterium]